MAASTPEKIRNVAAVPTAGMVTKVGTKVPMMLPIVLSALSRPTVLPVSSRLSTVNFVSDGVTVPSRTQGKANMSRHAANAAQTRKFFVMNVASRNDIPAIIQRPTNGMRAIHIAAMMTRRYSRSGDLLLSAMLPPHTLPTAMAIIITPIMTVHTIWDELK